jgi:hypothetical protein
MSLFMCTMLRHLIFETLTKTAQKTIFNATVMGHVHSVPYLSHLHNHVA